MKELIERHGKNLTTTSIIVAEVFGKRHDVVLRKIERLEKPTFTHLHLVEATYTDAQGKQRKMYTMNRC